MKLKFMQVLFLFVALVTVSSTYAQKKKKKSEPNKADTTVVPPRPATPPPSASAAPKTGPKPYKEIITSKAVTSSGLFKVHKVEDKYYFEIPDSLLGRDILIVSRLSKAAAEVRSAFVGYAGDQINEGVIRFEAGPNNKVFIKSISFQERSKDSSENGMYRNVRNSNVQPIIAAFDVKAYNADSSNKSKKAVVIEMTDYCSADNDVFFFDAQIKSMLRLSSYQADKSYVESIKAYPINVEIKTVKTYMRSPQPLPGILAAMVPQGGPTPVTFELNTSIVLLPKVPMKPRYFDSRVGYFATGYTDFDKDPQGVERVSMITRWRLEPKDEDIEKYKRGELVEPKNPIIYYIDPTTPKKWVPYLMQGVNDWQVTFEKAGFKNAIIAKEAPVGDSTWSLDDATHSAIVYKPSDIPNASGPHVHDPRSGEIIESHINWYHNVMYLLHNWYMIQTGAVDERARKVTYDDELMGQLIRFVSSHEVGHTLGLRHNFGSSSTVPVENLRNKAWVEANGHTPSIMDYARFNYVAQPEDNISEKGLFPRIGAYDKWAIEWGYKWMPEFKTADDEEAFMNKWIIDSLNSNKYLWFGTESDPLDPRCQNEDIGEDAMKASTYGIKNLQRIIVNLDQWTYEPNKSVAGLNTMYKEVASQYSRYMGHVAKNIGGFMTTPKSVEQSGPIFEYVPKAKQKEAMAFLQEQLFKTPTWFEVKKYTGKLSVSPITIVNNIQDGILGKVLSPMIAKSLIDGEAQNGSEAYSYQEMLNDLKKGIWSELAGGKTIDIYRRNLQKSYADKVILLVQYTPTTSPVLGKTSDALSIMKVHAKSLLSDIRAAIPATSDAKSKAHLQDLADRLNDALNPKK